MVAATKPLLTDLLRDVSRSFYTTMRVLPSAIRDQISLAYLLARTTDTIADTEIVPVEERLDALSQLRGRILHQSSMPLDFQRLIKSNFKSESGMAKDGPRSAQTAERVLLSRVNDALALLDTFSNADQQLIRDVLTTITSGQELDLKRFANASQESIIALETDAELDDYTFRVAGCVGEFWTRICRAHLFPESRHDLAALIAKGIRFGKGLQMVNILRDVPADLRTGRCYLPETRLVQLGLKPKDLLDPNVERELRPLYNDYVRLAHEHLAAGWTYTNQLPFRLARVRLACAWPILIGMATLKKLQEGSVLDPAHRIKISRAELRSIMTRSILLYPAPMLWRRLFV
ncbi:MAG: phytoene/squalene synthase family protein [Verrucomicrobiota bacterium]